MAVQAQPLSHGFPHDLHAYSAVEDGTIGNSLFLDEHGGCAPAVAAIGNTVFSDVPRSDLTCNENNYNYDFVPRKRARVVAPAPVVFDGMLRAMGSGGASTSGRMADATGLTQGVVSQLHRQSVEIDALVRLESERMRGALKEARHRHVRALVAAAECAAAARLREVDAELVRARCRNAELEERLRQMIAEGQAWMGVARNHEAVAAGLRATLDKLLQSPPAGGAAGEDDAEDAQSCCFETPAGDAASKATTMARRACGEGEACVLLLPCRHLCLCRACEAAAGACPVCAAAKNASLHVLLS